jgi:hypothetical protein
MRMVGREVKRELSGEREGRRSSPATASLVRIGQMMGDVVCLWECMVLAQDVEWSGGEGGEECGGGVWRVRWW